MEKKFNPESGFNEYVEDDAEVNESERTAGAALERDELKPVGMTLMMQVEKLLDDRIVELEKNNERLKSDLHEIQEIVSEGVPFHMRGFDKIQELLCCVCPAVYNSREKFEAHLRSKKHRE